MEEIIKLTANLDNNIISGFIIIDHINHVNSVMLELFHQYTLSQGGEKKVSLQKKEISNPPKEFQYSILNPRYLDNLFVEARVITEDGEQVYEVDVLEGVQEEHPLNPIREGGSLNWNDAVTHQENTPFNPNLDSTMIENQNIKNEILTIDQIHNLQEVSRELSGLFAEEATTNLAPDQNFDNLPTSYFVTAPGYVVDSRKNDGRWKISVTNTTLVNAFGEFVINTKKIPFNGSANYISVSLNIEQTERRATEGSLGVDCFDQNGSVIHQSSIDITIPEKGRIGQSFAGIPSSTSFISAHVKLDDVTDLDQHIVFIDKFQIETTYKPTTYTASSRPGDALRTPEINWKPPFYINLKTDFWDKGFRGLLDTTYGGLDGFQWLLSHNKMLFKSIDSDGNVVYNISSDEIVSNNGDELILGLFVTEDDISFYIDSKLLNKVPANIGFNFDSTAFVGRLESAGFALNEPILDFGVYRSEPV